MAKIKDFDSDAVILNALFKEAFIGDVLFAGVPEDCAKDFRAGTRFNEKTKLFVDKIGGRPEALKLLGDFLGVFASRKEEKLERLYGSNLLQLDVCYQIKLTKREKEILGRDLYLKFAFLPMAVDENSVCLNDEYVIVVDFHN